MLNPVQSASALDPGAFAPLLVGEGVILVSFYKPVLMLVSFLAWAWVVSTIFDKDSARWYFRRRAWNGFHVAMAVAAIAAVVALPAGPMAFWIGWPIMVVVLLADLLIYFFLRNRDDRVPAAFRWSLNPAKWVAASKSKKEKKVKKVGDAVLVFRGPAGEVPIPAQETPEYETRIAAEGIFQKALDLRASQIDILPVREGAYGVILSVDGVRNQLDPLPAQQGAAVIDIYKRAAGLDVGDRRRQQRGACQIGRPGAGLIDIGIVTKGASSGMRMTARIDPIAQVTRDFDELGLLPNQLADLKAMVEEGKGVVLQTAPPDHGRTTTFYALIRRHDAYTSNVQTVELEPEATIEGVRHNEFDPATDGAEFSTTVRSILRRDPDVLGVSEMPDPETAKEVARADVERTRVYLSFKADNALDAISRFAGAVGDQRAAADTLHGVVSQKLVRRLCHNCRVPFEPTPDILKKLGLPPDTRQLYRKSGSVLVKDKEAVCPVCTGTGYFGQVGVFSVNTIGSEERELIAAGDVKGLRGLLRQKKQQSIQTAALQHVLAGHTSVDELLRVISPPTSGSPPAEGQPSEPSPVAG